MRMIWKLLIFGAPLCPLSHPARPDPAGGNVLSPLGHVAFCERYPDDCRPVEQSPLLENSATARQAQLALVHSAVNASIAPRTDGDLVDLDWVIAPAAGDCDDYAVTKRHELLKAGWASAHLLLAEVALKATGEHHLILLVRDGETIWVLDNLRDDVVPLNRVRDDYVWKRIESERDPRIWTRSIPG